MKINPNSRESVMISGEEDNTLTARISEQPFRDGTHKKPAFTETRT
ncbi:MAG: hypothetical protein PHV51_09880 [Methanosarcinaceae archaeon]|nr:hypothetical protein [Methanosarcinaceae archaeon]